MLTVLLCETNVIEHSHASKWEFSQVIIHKISLRLLNNTTDISFIIVIIIFNEVKI